MKMKMFSVFDSKVGSHRSPMFMRSRGEALRGFIDVVNAKDNKTEISNHPEDFTLFYLGEFDLANAKFSSCGTPESLGVGIEFVHLAKDKVGIL